MKPARILLLVVAIVAGGLAAFMASRGQAPQTVVQQVAEVQQEAKVQVLVATTGIGVGERLTEQSVMWQDWPEGAVRPEYITSQVLPDAMEQMPGTVARFEIFTGEPIRTAKLMRSDQGFLSVAIPKGMRAVSIPVTAETGAGGFIVPNDRVDVVHTFDEGNGPVSSTILHNVKVVAMGARLGEIGKTGGAEEDPNNPQSQLFGEESIATVELTPRQAETIIAAASQGQLSLILRSILDFNDMTEDDGANNNQAIRLVRFGTSSQVQSVGLAEVTPATVADPGALATEALESVAQPVFTMTNGGSSDPEQAAAPAAIKQ